LKLSSAAFAEQIFRKSPEYDRSAPAGESILQYG